MNTNRADLAALAALTAPPSAADMFEGNPIERSQTAKSRFNAKSAPAAKQRKLPPGVIEMYTPESDFMEMVQVREGSPQHIKMLRQAEAMEPGSEEGGAGKLR